MVGTNGYVVLRDCATINFGNAYAFITYGSYFESGTKYALGLLTRDIVLNRPSRDDDVFSDKEDVNGTLRMTVVSDQGSSIVRLSPFSADYGEEARVVRIIIDFTYWRNSANNYATPTMKLRIKTMTDGTDNIYTDSTSFNTWAADTSNLPNITSSYRGRQARYVYDIPLGDFNPDMFVELHDIESIALNKVTVDHEVRPDNFTTRNY